MKAGKKAFTLIELLVVIALIALLLSVLTPVLKRAREAGKRAVCHQNTRTLAMAALNYCQENDAVFPSCNADSNGDTFKAWVKLVNYNGTVTLPTAAPFELQWQSLRDGCLWPYVGAEKSYRCPVAAKTEMRTYSMFVSINLGSNWLGPSVMKLSELRNAGSRGLFIDDYMDNWDADWTIYFSEPRWWNPVPMRHGKGTVLSFADGHSEWWDWEDPRTLEISRLTWLEAETRRTTPLFEQRGNLDLLRSQRTTWGRVGYK